MKRTPYSIYNGVETESFIEWDYNRVLVQSYWQLVSEDKALLARIVRDEL